MRVVLVRPRGGGNVGAACRAIKNMGAGDLYVVGAEFDVDQARIASVHAGDVLVARRETATLGEAIEGCSLVVGTSARAGAYHERALDVRTLASEIAQSEASQGLAPALVFGPEDSGLDNLDLALCHRLAFVPTSALYASLNLAQAVVVCLYEVLRARQALDDRATAEHATPQSSAGDDSSAGTRTDAGAVEAMYRELEGALLTIGFLSDDNPKHVMVALRDLLGRAGLDDRELRILRGLARQIRWFADGGREVAQRKRERGDKLR